MGLPLRKVSMASICRKTIYELTLFVKMGWPPQENNDDIKDSYRINMSQHLSVQTIRLRQRLRIWKGAIQVCIHTRFQIDMKQMPYHIRCFSVAKLDAEVHKSLRCSFSSIHPSHNDASLLSSTPKFLGDHQPSALADSKGGVKATDDQHDKSSFPLSNDKTQPRKFKSAGHIWGVSIIEQSKNRCSYRSSLTTRM